MNNNINKHYDTEEDFKKWLTGEEHPRDLDSVLKDWEPEKKAAFLNAHLGTLESKGCVYFTGSSNIQ